MKPTFSWLSILLAAGFASSNCVAEDLTVVSNVITNGHPAGTETDYISADHIRHSLSQGTDMIIDLKTGAMTNINAKKKTYYVVTKQDMEATQKTMNERMSDPKMKQAMAETTVDAGVMKTTTSSEVAEVSRASIPASTWEVPAGFTRRDNPMMRSLQQHER